VGHGLTARECIEVETAEGSGVLYAVRIEASLYTSVGATLHAFACRGRNGCHEAFMANITVTRKENGDTV
jgi:hypothetical protein